LCPGIAYCTVPVQPSCSSATSSRCTVCDTGHFLQPGAANTPDTCPFCTNIDHCEVQEICTGDGDSRCAQCAPGFYVHNDGVRDSCQPCTAVDHCALPGQITVHHAV
jgi:hypothetical protein